jgi:hypothetical protein
MASDLSGFFRANFAELFLPKPSIGSAVAPRSTCNLQPAATIDLYRNKARAEARQRLNELAHKVGLSPRKWEPCVVEDDASMRIFENEQSHDCDHVVRGKHRQSTTADLLLSSMTKHAMAEGRTDRLVSPHRCI